MVISLQRKGHKKPYEVLVDCVAAQSKSHRFQLDCIKNIDDMTAPKKVMAGCSTGHKSSLINVSWWDLNQSKKWKYRSGIFSSKKFLSFHVVVTCADFSCKLGCNYLFDAMGEMSWLTDEARDWLSVCINTAAPSDGYLVHSGSKWCHHPSLNTVYGSTCRRWGRFRGFPYQEGFWKNDEVEVEEKATGTGCCHNPSMAVTNLTGLSNWLTYISYLLHIHCVHMKSWCCFCLSQQWLLCCLSHGD